MPVVPEALLWIRIVWSSVAKVPLLNQLLLLLSTQHYPHPQTRPSPKNYPPVLSTAALLLLYLLLRSVASVPAASVLSARSLSHAFHCLQHPKKALRLNTIYIDDYYYSQQ